MLFGLTLSLCVLVVIVVGVGIWCSQCPVLLLMSQFGGGGGGAQQGRRGNQNSGNREPEWSGWESVRMGGSDNKGDGLASQPCRYRVPRQPLLNWHQVGGVSRSPDGLFAQQEWEPIRGRPAVRGEKDIWWTAGTTHGGTGHLGLTHTETQHGRLRTACGQRRVDSKNSQMTPATTSTSSIRQLLGAADVQTAHHATFSTTPTHQIRGSANAETTPAGAPAAAADRKRRPDAACEGRTGDCQGPRKETTTRRNVTRGGGGLKEGGVGRPDIFTIVRPSGNVLFDKPDWRMDCLCHSHSKERHRQTSSKLQGRF